MIGFSVHHYCQNHNDNCRTDFNNDSIDEDNKNNTDDIDGNV